MISKCLYKLYRLKFLRKMIIKVIAPNCVVQSKSNLIRRIYKDYHNIIIGYGSYGGCFNYKNINANVRIGKYCSFAKNVYYYNANHPTNSFTTHPIYYNPEFGVVTKENITRNKLTIGNDVWIGQNVIILANVTNIGNGVIIGAGSVVTKNIPDYAVVVGNPAKLIKYRFSKDIIDKLNNLKWWDIKNKDINIYCNEFYNINNFVNKLGENYEKINDKKSEI
ncbi:CatB-related O-acetyltransferase [Clostridium sp. UBA4395]|uniref:CatB-related O-acetyltransferase n=1 Tax=Clostridium sp. UBA4395 TaxID=1946360 RepID=UPI003217E09B